MTKHYLLSFFIFAQAFAFAQDQEEASATRSRPIEQRMGMMGMSSNGLRVGISKALLNGQVEANATGARGEKTTGDIRNDFGVSLGYAYLPTQEFGFLGHVAYNAFEDNVGAVRVDANGAYSFQENFYAFGGLNMNKIVAGNQVLTDLDMSPGYQLGLGFQISKQFGLDVQYISTRNTRSIFFGNGVQGSVDLRMSGIEFVAHATF